MGHSLRHPHQRGGSDSVEGYRRTQRRVDYSAGVSKDGPQEGQNYRRAVPNPDQCTYEGRARANEASLSRSDARRLRFPVTVQKQTGQAAIESGNVELPPHRYSMAKEDSRAWFSLHVHNVGRGTALRPRAY